jgi:alpha-D-xyloside xylohydrolase
MKLSIAVRTQRWLASASVAHVDGRQARKVLIARALFGAAMLTMLGFSGAVCAAAQNQAAPPDQAQEFVLSRDNATISVEPYGPNIVRITMSEDKAAALAAPGYGFVGKPAMEGWSHTTESNGADVMRSGRMIVRIAATGLSRPKRLPLDALNQELRVKNFGSGPPRNARFHGPYYDTISITTAAGKPLLTMWNWSMIHTSGGRGRYPNPFGDGPAALPNAEPDYRVSATFDSPTSEQYYGLGQHQQGFLDLRDHSIHCWQEYHEIGGETVCVPFMVSSRDYGLIWDNPSKTIINLGFNQQNVWTSEVGDRVSFFVIAGNNTDQVYEGYRKLTGVTHLLPKGVYGYIQSKAIYPTQAQVLAVAKGYRERHLPLDVIVVDFLNETRQGALDLDPSRWPDPLAMNKELNAMGIHTLISVWPHFAPGSEFYPLLKKNGWFISTADGTPHFTSPIVGPNIDTTNPGAAKWWWDEIRDRYIKKYDFSYIWLDETEPDIDPIDDVFHVGPGREYYNIYPLFHTASIYDGSRRDFGDSRRVFSLVRAAYLGAQANGTVFWSSDIESTWDMLKRSIPAGLDFTASGMPYWDTDIAGFFSPDIYPSYSPAHTPLVSPEDVRANVDGYSDYPELFVRWFEWGAFQPVMRAHGEREHNEVWAYGKQAEPILEKYLRLRYQLMPYTYSLAYHTYQTGAPFMRALFMDFPHDPKVANITDEYMYGPAFLVAPVTTQGATSRMVYLPAGTDWYNYWTNQRYKGGQTITVAAPIDVLPLFVRAGSIVPLGTTILSTQQHQGIASIRVYPGANGNFTLFSDDGTTYAYEQGHDSITTLHWDNAARKLTHEGAAAWSKPDKEIVDVIHAS